MKPVRAVARAALAAIFISSGAQTLVNPEPLVPKAKRITDRITPAIRQVAPKIPTDAETLIRVNGGIQVAAGALLATGRATRLAALVLAGSLIPTTLAGHAFWTYDTVSERSAQRTQFLKNLGLLGGLVLATVDTAGKPGLSWRTRQAAKRARQRLDQAISPKTS